MIRIAICWLVILFNGRDLSQWEGDLQQWKVERGMLVGRSDGKSESVLVLDSRQLADFELRFDLPVNSGAAAVHMRGPGKGPLGVQLEVGASVVRWLVNGSPFSVAFNVKPGEWNAYRIVCKGSSFDVLKNEAKSALTIVVGHIGPHGRLALVMPGQPSEVEFRSIELRNSFNEVPR